MANFISYFLLMTLAWVLIDALGRRTVMLYGSGTLTTCFLLLAVFGGLSRYHEDLQIPIHAVAVPGIVALFVATGAFGIGWLTPVWLIPTEIYPTAARAHGTAVSVVVWVSFLLSLTLPRVGMIRKQNKKNHTNHIMIHTQGLANFTITLITPILFNNLYFYIYLIFAATNLFAGVWTYLYSPETGGRSFEENQEFFEDAKSEGTWRVAKIDEGEFCWLPYPKSDGGEESGESQPLLRRVRDQVTS